MSHGTPNAAVKNPGFVLKLCYVKKSRNFDSIFLYLLTDGIIE